MAICKLCGQDIGMAEKLLDDKQHVQEWHARVHQAKLFKHMAVLLGHVTSTKNVSPAYQRTIKATLSEVNILLNGLYYPE